MSPLTGLPMDAVMLSNHALRGLVLDYVDARQRQMKKAT